MCNVYPMQLGLPRVTRSSSQAAEPSPYVDKWQEKKLRAGQAASPPGVATFSIFWLWPCCGITLSCYFSSEMRFQEVF